MIAVLAGVTALGGQFAAALPPAATEYGYALALPPFLVIFWRYIVWHNHFYVMTDRRIIQLNGVFEKEVADSVLEKLNDVKIEQSLLGRIFGYGDIEILTASEAGINSLKFVSRPLAFKRAMLEAQEAIGRPTVA